MSVGLVAPGGRSPPRRITSGPHDGAPRWSPDGATLAFLRPTDGHTQLYLLSLAGGEAQQLTEDRKSTRLNSSHLVISYAVFCLKKKKTQRVELSPISS